MVHFHCESRKMRTILFLAIVFTISLLAGQCRCQKINNHLRIASFYNPLANLPNVSINKMGIIESQLIFILSQYLNFTYEIHVPKDVLELGSPNEKKGNASWTGVMGQLVRDEVDMSISFGPLFYSRYLAVDGTTTIIFDEISIMIPYPESTNSAASYLTGFAPMTQIFIIGSICVVPMVIWIIALIEKKGEQDLGNIFVFITSDALGQGGYLRQNGQYSLATRLVHGAWLLAWLVIVYAFNGVLISIITRPRFELSVRSLEDVAAIENTLPLMINESSTHVEFQGSSNPIFEKIFKRIETNPNKLLVPSSSELVDLLVGESNQSHILADSEIQQDLKKIKTCRATLLPKIVKSTTNSLYLKKDSRYTPSINRMILLINQAGLSEYLDNSYGKYASRCYIDENTLLGGNKRNSPPSPLTLYNVRGIFYTFAYLVLVSFVVFLCELLCNMYRHV